MRGDQQHGSGQIRQPAGEPGEDQAGGERQRGREAQHREIRGVGQELAAFQRFEELRVDFDAGDAALAVGRGDAVVGGGNGGDADEDDFVR